MPAPRGLIVNDVSTYLKRAELVYAEMMVLGVTWVLRGRRRCHAVRVPFRDHVHHVVDPVFGGILGEILRVGRTIYLTAIAAARPVKETIILLIGRVIYYLVR